MSVKKRTILKIGLRFVKNEFLKKIYFLFQKEKYVLPNLVDIKLTLRCNLRCRQCWDWKQNRYDELQADTWEKILLNIKRAIGPYYVRFYGGEPFVRMDFLELVDFCSRHDILTLITTNGTLINKTVANELVKREVALINISLDGFKPETHDTLRGVQGTYHRVMRSIEYLKGKIPMQVNTTIMNNNLDEILDLAVFAYKNKLQISFQGIINMWTNDGKLDFSGNNDLFPFDFNKVCYIIDELCRMKKYNKSIVTTYAQLQRLKWYYNPQRPPLEYNRCERLYRHLCIGRNGDVYICFYLKPIGNLTKSSLGDICKSKETAHRIDEMKHCKVVNCRMLRGYHKESCGEIFAKIKRCAF